VDEYIHLYIASEFARGAANLDADEFVEAVELTLAECFQCVQTGEICDAKTIVAIYLWHHTISLGDGPTRYLSHADCRHSRRKTGLCR
jgi:ADP-ribose pyrophosphatase